MDPWCAKLKVRITYVSNTVTASTGTFECKGRLFSTTYLEDPNGLADELLEMYSHSTPKLLLIAAHNSILSYYEEWYPQKAPRYRSTYFHHRIILTPDLLAPP